MILVKTLSFIVAIVSYAILHLLGINYGWWLVIPGIFLAITLGTFLVSFAHAWIINPIRRRRNK